MQVLKYDGTFDGFLTAVFEIFEYRFKDVIFTGRQSDELSLFGSVHYIVTDSVKAERVLVGLKQRISSGSVSRLYMAFLSEIKDIEQVLLQYIFYIFGQKVSAEQDYSHPAVLRVQQVAKSVYREKHRMEAFVRFQLTKDKLYYAVVEPDFDVLPLLQKHFSERYADQQWMIYDSRRKYGLYYNLNEVSFVSLTFNKDVHEGKNVRVIYDENEELFQKLWKNYFDSVNIAARKNTKLHIAHMPKRYWKFLPEKKSERG